MATPTAQRKIRAAALGVAVAGDEPWLVRASALGAMIARVERIQSVRVGPVDDEENDDEGEQQAAPGGGDAAGDAPVTPPDPKDSLKAACKPKVMDGATGEGGDDPELPEPCCVTTPDGRDLLYKRIGTVAEVAMEGVLTRSPSWIDPYVGNLAYPTFIRSLNRAAADPMVKSILISSHSPGGSCFGCEDAIQAVRAAKKLKPVITIVRDLCCSGAFLIGAQSDGLYVTPTGTIGGAGSIIRVVDSSGMYAEMGLTTHVVVSFGAPYKGTAVEGAKITDEQLAELQRNADAYGLWFLERLSEGRGISPDDAVGLMDGRVEIGPDAVGAGFADGVMLYQDVVRGMQ